jgi:hypothetical protein
MAEDRTNSGTRDYRTLDAGKIVETIDRLSARISERFPGAGLSMVSIELGEIATATHARIPKIERRNMFLRLAVGLIVAGAIWLLLNILPFIDLSKTTPDNVFTLLQGVEAAMNILVLIGAILLFLFTVEERMKRRRALQALHELRTIAHVIDMHQLTKDPSAVTSGLPRTEHSPVRTMTPAELVRYLDYCSEMLSLTAKVAALYAQSLPDNVVTEAVSDLERVTANMSQKIWQKIMIVEAQEGVAGSTRPTLLAPVPPAALPRS